MSNKVKGVSGNPRTAHNTLNVGHGNFFMRDRVVAILESGSLPMKRLREKASERNLLVDATAGRKTRSLVITDSHHVILSALAPHTLQDRAQEESSGLAVGGDPARIEWEEGEFVS